jgi:hypothetical protein
MAIIVASHGFGKEDARGRVVDQARAPRACQLLDRASGRPTMSGVGGLDPSPMSNASAPWNSSTSAGPA